MIARAHAATLRERVEQGRTDKEIAEEFSTSERSVRRALEALGIRRQRQARGEQRGPAYSLRFESVEQREEVHKAARAAGRDTSEWLLDLAIEGRELARVARDPAYPQGERRMALAELFELFLGPKDRDPDAASSE